jgi:hypothetical protein
MSRALRRKPRRVSSKFPDDPSIRVDLAESFRRDLKQRRRVRVARKVLSPGRSVLHPSSVSRYIGGKVSPTLIVAKRLAAAVGKPVTEAVAGYSARYGRPTESWTKELLFARTFRRKVFEFLGQFANVLGYVHFGFPADPARGYRRVVRPQHERPEYGYFEVQIEEPVLKDAPVEFILSYLLFEHPPLFIDYGRIAVGVDEVSGFELWTRRSHREQVSPGVSRVWVQTWLDGKVTDFVVRSSCPFTLSRMLSAGELPDGPLTVIPFHPGGIHRHAPAGV